MQAFLCFVAACCFMSSVVGNAKSMERKRGKKSKSAEEKGLEIAQKADAHHAGFGDYKVDAQFILEDSSGSKAVKEMTIQLLEGKEDLDKALMVFHKPRDVNGTALLTHAKNSADDDQWIYLPAIKREKRILAGNRKGPFLGSEFSYEDLVPRTVDDYSYKFLAEKKCNRLRCYIIEAYPKDKNSAYSKQIAFIDKAELRFQRIVFFDKKRQKLKVMEFSGYKKYKGKHWAPSEAVMTNLISKKKTTIKYSDYNYQSGLTDRDFDVTSLKRGI